MLRNDTETKTEREIECTRGEMSLKAERNRTCRNLKRKYKNGNDNIIEVQETIRQKLQTKTSKHSKILEAIECL